MRQTTYNVVLIGISAPYISNQSKTLITTDQPNLTEPNPIYVTYLNLSHYFKKKRIRMFKHKK